MNENYADLLNRIGELLKEVQQFKKDISNHENEVKENIQSNSDFLINQKKLLAIMKSEVKEHNMEYKLNLEELTKYIQDTIISDLDKHINKKMGEINKMIRPLEYRVIQFQDAVNDIDKTVNESMIRLRDIIEESNLAYKKHTNSMESFSNKLNGRGTFDDLIITDKETIGDLIKSNINNKLQIIIEMIADNMQK